MLGRRIHSSYFLTRRLNAPLMETKEMSKIPLPRLITLGLLIFLPLSLVVKGFQAVGIHVDSNGNVGIGTDSPDQSLDIERAGAVRIDMNNTTATNWRIRSGNVGNFAIADPSTTGSDELVLTPSGDLTILGSLVTGGGGTCDPGPCDRTFADYALESIEEHASYMWENHHLWGVGPTPEGAPINLSKKLTGILHELEKAHIYIEKLNSRLKALEVPGRRQEPCGN